jgi:PAS domain S-box-containing protein
MDSFIPSLEEQTIVKGRSLASFLARLIWLSVLPLLLAAAWLAIDNVRKTQEETRQQAASTAKNFTSAIDHFLQTRIGALHMLAVSPLADDPKRWPELYTEAQGFRESFGTHVILADTGEPMRMLFNTRTPFGAQLPPLPRPKGHAAAPAALESGRPAVGDIFMGPIAKEPLVAIAVPGIRDGKVAHLLLTILETKQFQQRLEQEILPATWSLTLKDGRGEVIAQQSPAGFEPNRDVEEDGRFVTRSTLSSWSVAVEIPRDAMNAPLISAGISLAAALAIATIAGVLGGMLAGRRLNRQVISLTGDPSLADLPMDIIEIVAVRQKLDDAAANLRLSENKLTATFEQATIGIALVDFEGRCLTVNRAVSTMFGYSNSEMLTKTWQQLTHPDDLETDLEYVRKLFAHECDSYSREKRFLHKDGSAFWANLGVTLLKKPDGTPDNFLAVVENIQARKEIEAKLIEREALLSDMSAMTHVGGWTFDPATGRGDWTAEAARIHDLPVDAPINVEAGLSYYIGEHRQIIAEAVRTAIEQGRPYDLELEMQTATGRRKWVRTIGHPVHEEGKVVKMRGAIQDLTERKLDEIALAQSEQRYRELIENANSAIIHWAPNGAILFYNEYAQDLFGWNAAEIIGQHVGILVPDQDSTGADLSKMLADIAAHPERYQQNINENIRRDGSRIWMNWTNRAIRDERGQITSILAVGNDITQLKKTEEELKRRNEELERLDRASVGRELQMIALKRQINELSQQLGRTPPFDLSFVEVA